MCQLNWMTTSSVLCGGVEHMLRKVLTNTQQHGVLFTSSQAAWCSAGGRQGEDCRDVKTVIVELLQQVHWLHLPPELMTLPAGGICHHRSNSVLHLMCKRLLHRPLVVEATN